MERMNTRRFISSVRVTVFTSPLLQLTKKVAATSATDSNSQFEEVP